jgi:hypothetical protein
VETAGLTLFVLVLFLGVFLTIVGLPGTVLIVADALVYALATGFSPIGLKAILALAAIAAVAELLDIGLDMMGAVRFSLSVRGILAALFGSLTGAIVLTPFFWGPGALVGTAVGGVLAVFVTEMIRRRKLKAPFRPSMDVVLGRMAGMTAKGMAAVVMAAVSLFHIYS